ncbi:MAG: 6,7-dimethyl-8-ribityllumazine synthase [Gemmatimonadota bacterium]|jgi:6,7-dimethyl-8-ribityllumazine synthase
MSGAGSYQDELDGRLDGSGAQVAVVAARFNGDFTGRMLESTLATLVRHGVDPEDIEVVRVPGAWELPQAVAAIAETGAVDVVVALGCVIRGDTPHFDFVAGEAARGLMDTALASGVPVILGLLTTETREQAAERADPERQDKGGEAALAALEMAALFRTDG